MTVTEKNFIPMLLLASGSFAASGDATLITQQFSAADNAGLAGYSSIGIEYLNITSTGAYTSTSGTGDSRYFIYQQTTQDHSGSGKSKSSSSTTTSYLNAVSLDGQLVAWMTPVSTDSGLGTANSNYTGTMKTQLYSGANSSSKEDAFNPNHANDYSYSAFTQLKFELDGITTYGVAELLYINQGAPQLKSLSYEVNDAVNSVPEPAVWMEMIAGFGAIGAAIRRRRRVPLSFAAELGA